MSLADHPTVVRYREKYGADPPVSSQPPIAAETLKSMAAEAGAEDAGLVSISDPALADQRAELQRLFPGVKTLVSVVCRLNRGNVRCVSRAVSDLEYMQGFERVNQVARKMAFLLAEQGVGALTPSCGFPMPLIRWPGKIWEVSHKTVATAAGLGRMGHNRLFMHPVFGNFVLLGTLLIDRETDRWDAPIDYNPCIGCGLCAAVCPTGAIGKDGHFCFVNCMVHNYRDRLGGFSDWVENIVQSRSVADYRRRVSDKETVSMWQSLSYGICNKSSYCMAVCPAGDDNIGDYLADRKMYIDTVVKPLQAATEPVYVMKGSDAEAHVARRFPHKQIRCVGTGLRPDSAGAFLSNLGILFQREQSAGLVATFHFTFTGAERLSGTVVIKDKSLSVTDGLTGRPDVAVTADAGTWLAFLAKEKSLPVALVQRKIRIRGKIPLMQKFARCFPL